MFTLKLLISETMLTDSVKRKEMRKRIERSVYYIVMGFAKYTPQRLVGSR